MTDAVSIVGSAMLDDIARLNTISTNMVNIQTPGYKRLLPPPPTGFDDTLARTHLGNPVGGRNPLVDASAGAVTSTHGSLDVSLNGTGFLEVRNANGSAYTRLGAFHVDQSGQLVTQSGDIVQGRSGAITVSSQKITISPDGTVLDAGKPVGQLHVVDVPADALVPLGNATYRLVDGASARDSTTTRVQQGFLENSNVDPARETVSMMELMRHAEGLQKVANGYEEMMDTAIQKLGGQ